MEKKKLVIDNGSHSLRAGWSDVSAGVEDSSSSSLFSVRNLLLKPRSKTTNSNSNQNLGHGQPGTSAGNQDWTETNSNATTTFVGDVPPECLAGFDAFRAPVKSAFERNVVCNFEVTETVFDYVFDNLQGLGSACEGSIDHEVVLTECVRNPICSRQLMAELLFETYGVPGLHMGPDCTFAYAHNKYNSAPTSSLSAAANLKQQARPVLGSHGIVIGMGHSATNLVPIVNGVPHHQHSFRLNVSGLKLTTHLHSLLELKQQQQQSQPQHGETEKNRGAKKASLGKKDHPLSGFNLVERIKHRICLAAYNYHDQLRNIQKAVEGRNNNLNAKAEVSEPVAVLGQCACPEVFDIIPELDLNTAVERIQIPELYFQPSIAGVDQMGLTDTIVTLSKHVAMEVGLDEETFLESVLLVGGSSQFEGMSRRIERELQSRCKVGTKVNVFKSEDACLDAWKGAADYANGLLKHQASFATFVDKSTYDEMGMERTFLYN